MQTSGEGVVVAVELATRVELGKNELYAAHMGLGVHVRGHAAAVVLYRGGAVGVERYGYLVSIAVGSFVYGVIYNFPQNVVKSLYARGADVHAGADAHRLQPFKNF